MGGFARCAGGVVVVDLGLCEASEICSLKHAY